jgi:hypothetical protein
MNQRDLDWLESSKTQREDRDVSWKGLTKELIDDDIAFLKEILREWE